MKQQAGGKCICKVDNQPFSLNNFYKIVINHFIFFGISLWRCISLMVIFDQILKKRQRQRQSIFYMTLHTKDTYLKRLLIFLLLLVSYLLPDQWRDGLAEGQLYHFFVKTLFQKQPSGSIQKLIPFIQPWWLGGRVLDW